eukprot:365295-Chlamydomonas_euryale.AAC.9
MPVAAGRARLPQRRCCTDEGQARIGMPSTKALLRASACLPHETCTHPHACPTLFQTRLPHGCFMPTPPFCRRRHHCRRTTALCSQCKKRVAAMPKQPTKPAPVANDDANGQHEPSNVDTFDTAGAPCGDACESTLVEAAPPADAEAPAAKDSAVDTGMSAQVESMRQRWALADVAARGQLLLGMVQGLGHRGFCAEQDVARTQLGKGQVDEGHRTYGNMLDIALAGMRNAVAHLPSLPACLIPACLSKLAHQRGTNLRYKRRYKRLTSEAQHAQCWPAQRRTRQSRPPSEAQHAQCRPARCRSLAHLPLIPLTRHNMRSVGLLNVAVSPTFH